VDLECIQPPLGGRYLDVRIRNAIVIVLAVSDGRQMACESWSSGFSPRRFTVKRKLDELGFILSPASRKLAS